MKFTLLIVDDEKNIREGISEYFTLSGYEVTQAQDGDEAIKRLDKGDIDLVITDLRMPKVSGEAVLKHAVAHYPTVPVIMLTGHGTVETAVEAMRDGAYDFISKPLNLDHLELMVKRALKGRETELKNRELIEEVEARRKFSSMIGKSPEIKKIFEVIQRVAPTKASVLITGESGVGKELVADAIHSLSPRRDKPFIKVHCAALAESLLESELFGHEKGSFTGAQARKRGRFELANEGSLFLDEIGEIDQNVQIKILRVLQEKKFERVGGEETLEVDARIIAATNRDLKAEIDKGSFREDLYYRLNVINIHVPPLRERKDDIPLLAAAFLKEFSEENGKKLEGFDAKTRTALYTYPWPGNVRELRNCVESAVVMAKGGIVMPDDLPPSVRSSSESNLIRVPMGSSLDEAERILIRETLAANSGNKSKTADILGIGRKTLYEKIGEYGLDSE
jgi:putative PEP-CTERM system response regulator